MKKQFSILAVFVALFALATTISSCEKDEGKAPNISFKTTGSYTSADKNVHSGDTIVVGITASKAEDKDVLKSFSIQHTVNAGATSVTDNTINPLATSDENSFDKDFTLYPSGALNDKLKYTFSVTNRDGITGTVSFTLTVN